MLLPRMLHREGSVKNRTMTLKHRDPVIMDTMKARKRAYCFSID